MTSLDYEDLPPSELAQLGSIDRSKRIDALYLHHHGQLELRQHVEHVSGWDPAELAQYVARLRVRDVLGAGDVVLGAWNGARLVGLASLDRRAVGGDPKIMKLDMLYVDAAHRQLGFGTRLVAMLGERARSRGTDAALHLGDPHAPDGGLLPRARRAGPGDPGSGAAREGAGGPPPRPAARRRTRGCHSRSHARTVKQAPTSPPHPHLLDLCRRPDLWYSFEVTLTRRSAS
ncbi:MAG TPA: GNAT family N-acetyltransferase [Anaeromyxobacter sp.]|nr:GNAT family N-acetyltransferase [Anaeromyxobacter sp.]